MLRAMMGRFGTCGLTSPGGHMDIYNSGDGLKYMLLLLANLCVSYLIPHLKSPLNWSHHLNWW